MLLKHGGREDALDLNGVETLHFTVWLDNSALVQALVESGADVRA